MNYSDLIDLWHYEFDSAPYFIEADGLMNRHRGIIRDIMRYRVMPVAVDAVHLFRELGPGQIVYSLEWE